MEVIFKIPTRVPSALEERKEPFPHSSEGDRKVRGAKKAADKVGPGYAFPSWDDKQIPQMIRRKKISQFYQGVHQHMAKITWGEGKNWGDQPFNCYFDPYLRHSKLDARITLQRSFRFTNSQTFQRPASLVQFQHQLNKRLQLLMLCYPDAPVLNRWELNSLKDHLAAEQSQANPTFQLWKYSSPVWSIERDSKLNLLVSSLL